MHMGLGIGLGIAHSGARPYAFTNAEAAALVARFTTPPTDARKKLIDTLVGSLKTAGVWAKLDALYIMAAADSQAARRNWIQDAYNLTAVNTPTFTADKGYTGDGASAYLETSLNAFSATGINYALNSMVLGGWSKLSGASNGVILGNGNAFVTPHRTDNLLGARANDASTLTVGNSDGTGYYAINRSGSATRAIYKNGASVASDTTASLTISGATIRILTNGGSGSFWTGQTPAAFFGASLSDTEQLALYNALSTYLTAIGAN